MRAEASSGRSLLESSSLIQDDRAWHPDPPHPHRTHTANHREAGRPAESGDGKGPRQTGREGGGGRGRVTLRQRRPRRPRQGPQQSRPQPEGVRSGPRSDASGGRGGAREEERHLGEGGRPDRHDLDRVGRLYSAGQGEHEAGAGGPIRQGLGWGGARRVARALPA